MGKKILVVDDDPVGVSLMDSRLTRAGYDVSTAFDGEQGLRSARAATPALIILDVEMPEMNGYAFVHELKKNAALKTVPVIVLTSHEENQKIFARQEISNYLIKPVDFDVLFKLMEKILGPAGTP